MELDLQRLFGLHGHSVLIGWGPATLPPPHLGSYTRALLVSQDRRHLCETPTYNSSLTDSDEDILLKRTH